METTVEKYLGYLDKEMTIMGILSAFSASAAAFTMHEVFGSDKTNSVLYGISHSTASFVGLGAGLLLIAASFFYRERSLLAYYYGQLCLPEGKSYAPRYVLMEDADSWETWKKYQRALGFLSAGFLEYAICLSVYLTPELRSWYCNAPYAAKAIAHSPSLGLGIGLYFLIGHVLEEYKDMEDPWKEFWALVRSKLLLEEKG